MSDDVNDPVRNSAPAAIEAMRWADDGGPHPPEPEAGNRLIVLVPDGTESGDVAEVDTRPRATAPAGATRDHAATAWRSKAATIEKYAGDLMGAADDMWRRACDVDKMKFGSPEEVEELEAAGNPVRLHAVIVPLKTPALQSSQLPPRVPVS